MDKSIAGTQAQRLRQAIRHRQDREKQELRQAILAAAGELFLEQAMSGSRCARWLSASVTPQPPSISTFATRTICSSPWSMKDLRGSANN